MARPPKTVRYDADDQTIQRYFDQSMSLRDEQKAASGLISDLNSEMLGAGVDPGTLSICRRFAAMKPGKRGVSVALLHRYLQVLASRLDDPTVEAPWKPSESAVTVPFGSAKAA
jgi:hypothetical protein